MKLVYLWTVLSLPVVFAFDPDYARGIAPSYLVYLKSDYLPCTGALIHPFWVITAAHCNLPKLLVLLGITNPSNLSESNVQVVRYEKMVLHPHFSISSINYDLMLIKLKRVAELNDYVSVLTLPTSAVPVDATCTVSTWAYNTCDFYKDPDAPENVSVSVVPRKECKDGYPTYDIEDNMICVGIVPGRRLPCREVSAAPAVCDGVLHGVLSYADGCVLRADVGIYASIFHYLSWIEHTIQNN
ncbi:serine protease 58-like [Ctenodactylus gundi]